MQDLSGKSAFITGAASGIGVGMARAFLKAGMRVMIADVREEPLKTAAAALGAPDRVKSVVLDVTDKAAWARAGEAADAAFGKIHLLCSNAGVNIVGPTQDATDEDWQFCMGVNLGGAVNAIRTFVPRLTAHGEGGHIVITASVSGLFTGAFTGVYATSKYALVGLAESLRADLKPHGVGVSVLCPGPVQSELFESTSKVRPSALAHSGAVPVVSSGTSREATPIFATALTADDVGERVVKGVLRDDLYIMTHPEIRSVLEARNLALLNALPDEPIPPERVAATQNLLNDAIYMEQAEKPAP
jgi:NAD(P)-dependent dehydrogenase (short-subunit alcohol dehydrogenase family)